MSNCRIGYLNVHGLISVEQDIEALIASHGIDILFLTETWLREAPSLPNTVFHHPAIHSNYREGLLVVCRPDIHVEILSSSHRHISLLVGDVAIVAPYLSPSTSASSFAAFLTAATSGAFSPSHHPTFILGDLNVRLGPLTNDSVSAPSSKVQAMHSILSESWQLCHPARGRWTSTGPSGGHGITDHVLSSPGSGGRLESYVIIDCISPHISDHNMLLVQIECAVARVAAPPVIVSSARWHISRLRHACVRSLYLRHLTDSKAQVLSSISSITAVTVPSAQQRVDACLSVIMDWIAQAMTASCGYWRPSTPRRLPPEHLSRCTHHRRQIDSLVATLVTAMAQPLPCDVEIAVLHNAIRYHRTTLRKLLKHAASSHWLATADWLADPKHSSNFLKLLARLHARKTGIRSCRLKAADMASHSRHFTSTFGGPPTGTPPTSLPQLPSCGIVIPESLVQLVISKLPHGKSPGEDQIFNEMLTAGREALVSPLTSLFQLCVSLGKVPTRWKTALIHPVHKKGSDTDIANYRPIALTSSVRRVFEKCLLPDLELLDPFLSIGQAGFRRKQSVTDHLTVFHELTQTHPTLYHAFLDIKAAYDTVDRRLLWQRVGAKPGVSQDLLDILQALFDDNSSCLLIESQIGPPIHNLRGLLQGSSLSPILFNHFIDDLLCALSVGPRVSLHSILTNHLVFADDANLHATSAADLIILLQISEKWALRNGIQFSPTKSAIIAPTDSTFFLIHSTPIPQTPAFRYLGMTVTISGIDWRTSFERRRLAALARAEWFQARGMYLGGWRPNSNVLIYKAFLRPSLEFGFALGLLPRAVLADLQLCQNTILRKLLSAGRSTSLCAMHGLTQIAPIIFRNQLLHARYMRSISFKTSSLVRQIHDRALSLQPPASHLARSASTNPLLTGTSPPNLSDTAVIISLRQSAILAVSGRATRYAHLLRPLDARCHPVFRAVCLDRDLQRHIIHWMLGRYTQGSTCHRCQQPLSRDHAVRCSRTWDRLTIAFPQPPPATLNPLDFALSHAQFRPRDWYSVSLISITLQDIRLHCLGHTVLVASPPGSHATPSLSP